MAYTNHLACVDKSTFPDAAILANIDAAPRTDVKIAALHNGCPSPQPEQAMVPDCCDAVAAILALAYADHAAGDWAVQLYIS